MRPGSLRALLLAVLAVPAVPAVPATAAVDTVVVTHVGGTESNDTDYLPGSDNLQVPAVLLSGRTLQYRNLNTGLPHDLASTLCVSDIEPAYTSMISGGSCREGYRRLFASDISGFNQQKPVVGTDTLPPGDYGFYCTVHGAQTDDGTAPMAGSLTVVDSQPVTYAFTRAGSAFGVGVMDPTGTSQAVAEQLGMGELAAPVVVPQGGRLVFVNLSIWGHSIYSEEWIDGTELRLFNSEVIPFGKSSTVRGVPDLPPGTYDFFCSNHMGMKGRLTVVPA